MIILATLPCNYELCDGSGIVTSFYTDTESGVHNEIDFEFVGNNVSQVQTNYFVDG